MEIHEYQAKELLSQFGVPVPQGGLAYSPEQAAYRASEIGGETWVVKAQVHAGGRGKAGGIKLCRDHLEVEAAAEDLLGRKLVTEQTGPRGRGIYRLYVEQAVNIQREFYVGFVLDRKSERIMVVASAEGGMEIEEISRERPESIQRASIEPAVGMQAFQARELAYGLGFEAGLIPQVVKILLGCYQAFRDLDATMVEINPLAVTDEGTVLALDAKMTFDDNALFRRPNISELRDKSQEDPRESSASDRGLSYVGLDGKIGCIINGAGLAMATMDMILHAGGRTGELPRHRRRRFAGTGGQGLPAGPVGRERRGHPGQHLRRHQPLRLGRRRRGRGGAQDRSPGPRGGPPVGHQRR